MISPKFKRVKTLTNTNNDRSRLIATLTATIPCLPDSVIEQILSFLPIKLAAQATAVSKQWATLWPSFPAIDFDEGDPSDSDDPAKFRRFLRFLENSLKHCEKQRSLEKLRLQIIYSLAGDDKDTIDKCVTFVIERCVKELELCFVEAVTEVRFYLIPQAVFSSHFLTSLNLEKVRVNFSSRVRVDDRITLQSLKTMSLKEVEFDDEIDLEILIHGCPYLERLSLNLCDLGYTTTDIEISSLSLKSLEIMNCHSLDFTVQCINLETFMFVSECTCAHHGAVTMWECDNLKHLYVFSVGLKELHLLGCQESMENAIFTPSLVYFLFSTGVVEAKVHFVESPLSLLEVTVRIMNWIMNWHSKDVPSNNPCKAGSQGKLIMRPSFAKVNPNSPSFLQRVQGGHLWAYPTVLSPCQKGLQTTELFCRLNEQKCVV